MGEKAKTKKQDSTMVEFREAMMSTCTYLHRVSIPLQGLDRCVLTVGAVSGPHCQIGALHWRHFTSHGFTWSKESTPDK